MHGRDTHGALASLSSVAKVPYQYALDGIPNTFSIIPKALDELDVQEETISMLDGYASKVGTTFNINVFNRDIIRCYGTPRRPTINNSCIYYAVNFIKLTREQYQDVINYM